ncbi:hypothetical protein NDU88_002317 [Pleurodeles waltl]|uniref:Murine leukemia virus integrase C-terminal domain-containing protein n=1 Tax=Pleurodeles waltl TaxID=8319 RepID=A0AAV7KTU0_PLEWA|nr:hypothetical protein NDU88_002317 [Pleurodeles waltl]
MTNQHLQIGDRLIIKDRKPGWKFRTPYEPGVWVVSRVAGTMIMVKKANQTVSRNVSWFWKVTFKEPSTTEPDSIYLHPELGPDSPEPRNAGEKVWRADQAL